MVLWFLTESIYIMYSQLSISRICGDHFLQVQITRSANQFALRVIWTCKNVSDAKLWLMKAIKMYFWFSRRFEFRRIRDIRVRNIESRLYLHPCRFALRHSDDKCIYVSSLFWNIIIQLWNLTNSFSATRFVCLHEAPWLCQTMHASLIYNRLQCQWPRLNLYSRTLLI